MTQYDGQIRIGTSVDDREYRAGLRRLETETRRFTGSIAGMVKGAFAGAGIGLSVGAFADMAGVMTDLESRVKLAAGGMADAEAVMVRLRDIADTAYSPFESTAEAFLANSSALNALGLSMEKQLNLADALTNSLIVSGAKGEKFNSVMETVSRSIAVGRMGTQELETVLKHGSAAAEVMAKHLGVTVNELRGLAQQGKLTSTVITNALVGSMDELKAKAEDMPATIGDAFVRLRNEALFVFRDLNQSLNFETTVVAGIDKVKDNFSNLVSYAGNAAVALAAVYGGRALAGLGAYTQSQWNSVQAAKAQAAQAVRNAQAQQVMAQSVVNSARAQQQRASSAMAAQAAVRALAAAEAKLATATAAVAAAQKAANFSVATSALNGLKAAASGVLGIFGGPLGLALAAAGLSFYKIKQRSDELKATLEKMNQQASETADNSEENISAAARSNLERSQSALAQANKDLANMNAIFDKAVKNTVAYQTAMDRLHRNYTPGNLGEITDVKAASQIMIDFRKKIIDADEAMILLLEAKEKFGDTEAILDAIKAINGYEVAVKNQAEAAEKAKEAEEKMKNGLDETSDATEKAKARAKEYSDALALIEEREIKPPTNLKEAAAYLLKATEGAKSFAAAEKIAGEAAIVAAMNFYKSAAAVALLNEEYATYRGLVRQASAFRAGLNELSAKDAAEAAKKQADALREADLSLAKLQDKAGKKTVIRIEGEKELESYTKLLKDAGASTEEIAAKTEEFKAAWAGKVKTDAFKEAEAEARRAAASAKEAAKSVNEQNQALREVELTLARMRGDPVEVARLEGLRELERFSELVKTAGLNSEEAAAKIAEFQQAQAGKANTEHLQEQLNFYKELRQVMPAAGAEYDRVREQLLALEMEQYRAIGISQEFLDVWAQQTRLREAADALSGLTVAVQDYLSGLTPAAQAADLFKTSADAVSGGLYNMVTGAESVGEAFGNMAETIVNKLIEMMIQMYVMKPIMEWFKNALLGLSGGGGGLLGGVLGGLFKFSDGGVVTARGLDQYLNSIVTRPTVFPFAKGGKFGLMGESGPEAILPLARTSSGQLGVLVADAYFKKSAEKATAAPNVYINVVNRVSDAQVTAGQPKVDAGGNMSLEMVVDHVERQMARNHSQGRSAFANTLRGDWGTAGAEAMSRYRK